MVPEPRVLWHRGPDSGIFGSAPTATPVWHQWAARRGRVCLTGQDSVSDEAARIREHLARLAAGRARLESRLAELGPNVPAAPDRVSHKGPVNDRSPAGEKIASFRIILLDPASGTPSRLLATY